MVNQTIPVTVLSGNLGAGKTTVLNHLLRSATDREIAVLVNDMGEVNIDAELVAEASDISEEDDEIIELSNGCICCELRGDLLDAIGQLARSRSFDTLIIESTGVAEPLPVAQTLTLGFDQTDLEPTEFYEETGIEPLEQYHLDTAVTAVDAHQFFSTFRSEESLLDGDTEKQLGDLLVEQIEFCDVLLLNKCDLVDSAQLDEIEAILETLQPRAEIIRIEHGQVDPDAVLETGRFDFAAASQSAGWINELQEPHQSAEEEHGVTSFVFETGRPLHPERFADFLDHVPVSIVRAKGHFWIAGREDEALTLNIAGQSIRVGAGGQWIATLPTEEQKEYFATYPNLEASWNETWGDRGSQLVFIGTEMDHDSIRSQLQSCLLSETEMDEQWEQYDDRFPQIEPEPDPDSDLSDNEAGKDAAEIALTD
ncbi:GTP-binding protein [Natronocalculus amylovorans]|uniref:GTP-binding protein n=1 Tax=Natronocalculus amylovorans TaxID=2917812 RepID=A0AAE3FZ09_9EURY|nr:GTP-binding protein [Natronocalculus amylovorans]MCL9817279.1 GTP-binding protein [Natronocalculus amylovorans]